MLWVAEGMAESDFSNTDLLSDWADMADERVGRTKLKFAQNHLETICGVYNLHFSECQSR
jgi:hypothetical protein